MRPQLTEQSDRKLYGRIYAAALNSCGEMRPQLTEQSDRKLYGRIYPAPNAVRGDFAI